MNQVEIPDNISLKVCNLLEPFLTKLGICLTPQQYNKFGLLVEAMLKDPLYPSLSKIFNIDEIVSKHILDSLIPLTLNTKAWKGKKIIDLGTGAGFPCIPLAIVLSDHDFLAVDSREKSTDFVSRMTKIIGLNNLSTKHTRIELFAHETDYREKADLVICRGLSEARILLEYCLPLTKNGGYNLYYKGPKAKEELDNAANAIKIFGVKTDAVVLHNISLPDMPFERNFIEIHKTESVSIKYPRKAGTPSSNPL